MTGLSSIESQFGTGEEAGGYGTWCRAKVEKALMSPSKRVPHDAVMAKVAQVIERHRSK